MSCSKVTLPPKRSTIRSNFSLRFIAGLLTSANAMILQRILVILAQRITDPVLGQQDAPQIGMVGEPHAAQVVDLTLVPLGSSPYPGYRRQLRQIALLVVLPAGQVHLEHEAVAMREAVQMIDDLQVRLEAGLGRLL